MLTTQKDLILFTSYYTCTNTERQSEIDECVQANLNNTHFKEVVLVIDDNTIPTFVSTRLKVIHTNKRITYSDWIEYSKEYTNAISILCNSDIYFDDSISNIHEAIDTSHTFLCLTRWERIEGNITPYSTPKWSQDTWAFCTDTVMEDSVIKSIDIQLGIPRCDNKLAYNLIIHGWKIVNPINYIKSIHVHETQLRSYNIKTDDRNLGTVAFIEPGQNINDEVIAEFITFCKGNTQNIKQCSTNNYLKYESLQLLSAHYDDQKNTLNELDYIKSIPVYITNNNLKKYLQEQKFKDVLYWVPSTLDVSILDNTLKWHKQNIDTHISILFNFLKSKDEHRIVLDNIYEYNAQTTSLTLPSKYSFDVLYLVNNVKTGQENYIFNNICHTHEAYIITRRFAWEAVETYKKKQHKTLADIYLKTNTKQCSLICRDKFENICDLFV